MKTRKQQLKEIFGNIYESKEWGYSGDLEYYSGDGSDDKFTDEYCNVIKKLLQKLEKPATVVDLGCGDFRVGRKIVENDINYIGVDIFPKLIKLNQKTHGKENVAFLCKDIVSDELPEGDVCLIRQVLQHLSNEDILKILQKLSKYKYVFVTEHFPLLTEDFVPNKDIEAGSVRFYDHSAVALAEPPFNVRHVREVLVQPVQSGEGGSLGIDSELRTFLIENERA